jgi:rod shape-determining protein MreD
MPRLTIFGAFPNILVAVILIFAILKNSRLIFFTSFLAGVMLDVFSILPFGVYTMSLSLVSWLIHFVGKDIFRAKDLFGQFFLIFCASIAYSFLFFFFLKFFFWIKLGPDFSFFVNFSRAGLPEIGLNILLSWLFLAVFRKSRSQRAIPRYNL